MNNLDGNDKPRPNTLLSPLGLSPGLLYSAIKRIQPEYLVVLTSTKGNDSLGQIIEKAAYAGPVRTILVDDPFNCFHQAEQKVIEIVSVIGNRPCAVNLTGGTTAMQFIIQRVGTTLEDSGLHIWYVALIDRRDYQVQRSEPWVVGEMVTVMHGGKHIKYNNGGD